MERTDLPDHLSISVIRVIDWTPSQPVEGNPELLKSMKKRSTRQSARSRSRQNFFEGIGLYSDPVERRARARYLEEWRHRANDNEF